MKKRHTIDTRSVFAIECNLQIVVGAIIAFASQKSIDFRNDEENVAYDEEKVAK